MQVKFWGARGNLAPEVPSVEFGNHTTCVEIQAGDQPPLLVDFGSGARGAGTAWLAAGIREFDIFQTHFHHDHLLGLYTFPPFYRRDCTLRVHAVRCGFRRSLGELFAPPYHPVSLESVPARVEAVELPGSGSREFPRLGLNVGWTAVSHPQGCSAYRFDDGENAIVFATDVELGSRKGHEGLSRLICEPYPAGLLIVDGFFTDQEINHFSDWGHSSWTQARELMHSTGAGSLIITHHHPDKTDSDLRALEAGAGGILWARENLSYRLRHNRRWNP